MHSKLEQVLRDLPSPAIAVSGGVDSMTLAAAVMHIANEAVVFHAVSPAVPAEATARVKLTAVQRGWSLTVVEAGEFDDPHYRANPVNRCFHCKDNLYQTIGSRTDRQILSGANLDDLGEYRPGLLAAREHNVRHPYVEAGIDKQGVRRISRELGLGTVADLPASPCLASRVETGIRIEATTLGFIHEVEQLIARQIEPGTVRCRVRANAVVVELDGPTLSKLTASDRESLLQLIGAQRSRPPSLPIRFEPYRNGSAFLLDRSAFT